MPTICIYAASSSKIDDRFKAATRELISSLVKQGFSFVYGGGSTGLMGETADTVLKLGGKITGIIPGFMKELEWNHPGVKDMIIVETMAHRKQLFFDKSDLIITLPGGFGTLEEIAEAITLKQLGQINHPMYLANFFGYYNGFLAQAEKFLTESCIRPNDINLWTSFNENSTFSELIKPINSNVPDHQLHSKL